MNKGLFIHIIATIIYMIMVLFVLNGEDTTKSDRIDVVALFIMYHALIEIIIFISSEGNAYKEKI